MDLRGRLPVALLGAVAVALIVLITGRLSAGAEPPPQQTTPIVLTVPTSAPTPSHTEEPDDDDVPTAIIPSPRDIDDRNDDHSGKGRGGDDDSGKGRDHPEDD